MSTEAKNYWNIKSDPAARIRVVHADISPVT